MKTIKTASVEQLQLVSRFEALRRVLLGEPYAQHLDRPLAYWALPADRRLPLAFLGRSLRDLLDTAYSELAATPGIGQKKMRSFVKLLARVASTDPAALPELARLLALPSAEVRRLAASAIGKLSGFGADPVAAVAALAPVALRDPHAQTQQYALTALKAYGTAASPHLADVKDLAENPGAKDYVRRAAVSAAAAIQEAARLAAGQAIRRCGRCNTRISADEYARSQKAFQRVFCDRCFDEIFLERRNFETQVELNKTIEARDGTVVQSEGERRLADWLTAHGLVYRYDAKFRIIGEFQIRPDFYLPELDVYIEYWGLDTPQYKMSMYKKQALYQQEGKRLVSVYPRDLPSLGRLLPAKLALFGYTIPVGER